MELKSLINISVKMFEDLRGKNILIVGATRGIGRQLASSLQELGANLHLTARTEAAAESLRSEIKSIVHICDLDFDEQVQELASQVKVLDGVCIVGGIVKIAPPKMLSKKSIDQQIITNLASPLNLVGALLRKSCLNEGASIVFTSAAGRICQVPCSAAYAGSKLGLIGATKSLAADLSPKKIRVNAVSFDYVDTDMIKSIKTTDADTIGVSPIEFSSIPYIFCLSSMSRWITGQTIAADAGRMLSKVRYV
jgi:NAD(P)-dependent dehydrogenase (short-subunit alcohol dehydrogenase family)